MRIVIVAHDLYPPELHAGGELALRGLASALAARGHQVIVCARTAAPTPRPGLEPMGDHAVIRDRTLEGALGQGMAPIEPDAILISEPRDRPMIEALERAKAIPIVAYVQSAAPIPELLSSPIARHTAFLAVGAHIARDLEAATGKPCPVVAPLWHIDRFDGAIASGDEVIGVGLQPRKGADIMVAIAEARPDHRFVFVKSWTMDPSATVMLEQRIARLPNARIVENTPDIGAVFRGGKLLIMASRSQEGFGRTAVEAQLHGLPVLASSRGNLPKTIGAGGITLDPDQPIDDWLAAFDAIVEDRGRRAKLGAAALAHARAMVAGEARATDTVLAAIETARDQRPRLVRARKQRRPPPLVGLDDARALARLALHAPTALLVPRARWPRYARALAGTAPSLGCAVAKVEHAMAASSGWGGEGHDLARLAIEAVAAREEVVLQALRGRVVPDLGARIALDGEPHLRDALADGGGAVLWVAHFVFATHIAKMALARAGVPAHQLSRPEHRLSKSLFGRAALNRTRTGFEDKHLAGRILYDHDNPAAVARHAIARMAESFPVLVTAGDWEGGTFVEAPFLGRRVRLAAGAPRLAVATRRPLLPVFAVREREPDDYRVAIGASLPLDHGPLGATEAFLAATETFVRAYPAQWRGWTSLT